MTAGAPPLAGMAGDVGDALVRRLEAQVAPSLRQPGLVAGGRADHAVRDGWACLLSGRVEGADAGALAARAARAGEAVLGELRGEFAVVLWDGARRRGFAAVDQLSARALYWRRVPGGVAFAADVRDLLALLPALPEPDRGEVLRFLASGAWSPTGTPFAGVQRLPGAGVLALGEAPRVRRHWAPRYRPVLDAPPDELAALVRERVMAAVARQLPRDGATGLMLSGGLDSCAVGAALRSLRCDVRAYSAIFPDHPEIDEARRIGVMIEFLDAPWVRSRISGGRPLLGTLGHVAAWRLPSTAPNVFLWAPLLRRAARDGVGVMLDGQGGDELFGAAPYLIADLVRRGRRGRALEVAARLPRAGAAVDAAALRRVVRAGAVPAALPWPGPWLYRRLRDPARDVPSWLARADARTVRGLVDPWRWTRRAGPRWWAHLVAQLTDLRESLDAHGFLHRRARQFGLRGAHPFLNDLGLVELALRLPPDARLDPRHDRPLLRAAMRGQMPEELRLRADKSYFTALLREGLRGRDAALVERLLRPRSALVGEFTDHDRLVAQLLDTPAERYPRGAAWWAMDAWRVASIEAWLRDLATPGWAARELGADGPAVEQEIAD